VQVGELVVAGAKVDVKWSEKSRAPFATGSAATAIIGDTVYYCGGINKKNTGTVATCAAYLPYRDLWSALGEIPDMPVGRNHAAACTDGASMFVFGGRSGKNLVGKGFADTQIFTPGVGWKVGTPLTVARGGMGKCVCKDGYCYVFGGEVWPVDIPSPARKINSMRASYAVDVYHIASNSWSSEMV
jgi:hypothetical protein